MIEIMKPTVGGSSTTTKVIQREDLLVVLASIGVVLPPKTKMPEEELTKRLGLALDAAQELHVLVEKMPLVVEEYPVWPTGEDLMDATTREPAREQRFSARIKALHPSARGVSTDKKDTFKELRQVVFSFGHGVKSGYRHFCLMDEARIWGVYIRMVQVRKVKDKPLFVFMYKEVHSTETETFVEAFGDYVDDPGDFQMGTVKTTDLERLAMLKLFRQNAKRLSPDYCPIDKSEARQLGLKVSFAFPLVPPHMKDLRRLADTARCEICGNTKISRCLQCLSAAYCSPVLT